jgi:CO dehydrogenase maturation factor
MLIVVEPYFRSLETARRMIHLGRQLDPEYLGLVANKITDERGREAVHELAASEGVEVAGEIPHDVTMLEADLDGSALLDYDAHAPSIAAIERLAESLLAGATA